MTNQSWKESIIRELATNTAVLAQVVERLDRMDARAEAAAAAAKSQRVQILLSLGSGLVAIVLALVR